MEVGKVFKLVLRGESLTSRKQNLVAHVGTSGIVIDKDGPSCVAGGISFFAEHVQKATSSAGHALIS